MIDVISWASSRNALYFVIQLGFACDTPIIGCSVIVLIVIKRQNILRSFERSELERNAI